MAPSKDLDEFASYLQCKSPLLKIALTDSSYLNVTHEENFVDNSRLETLGDAVLRLGLAQILYNDKSVKVISEKKKDYESDKVLVTVLGHHYKIRRHIRFDHDDKHKQNGYSWTPNKKGYDKKQKYIASAMEACLGAYYLEHGEDMREVLPILYRWMAIVDEHNACL